MVDKIMDPAEKLNMNKESNKDGRSVISELMSKELKSSSHILQIPYYELSADEFFVEGKSLPNGNQIVSKMLGPKKKIIGGYNKKTQEFEGLVKIEDEINKIECLVNIKNSQKNGHGVMKFTNGDLYKGNFVNGEFNGKGEYYFCETGNYIKGDIFRGGEINGEGSAVWFDKKRGKAKYSGFIKDGIPEGKGKINMIKLKFLIFFSKIFLNYIFFF